MKKIKFTSVTFTIILISFHAHAGELSSGLLERLHNAHHKEQLSVIIRMADQADLKASTQRIIGRNKALRSRNVIRTLKTTATGRQEDLISFLEKEKSRGNVVHYTSFWIFNGLSLKATPEVIEKIASRKDVNIVTEDFLIPPPFFYTSTPLQSDSSYTWNIEKIRAPDVWDMGYNGSGVVVGIFDTGVDVTHPDLANAYRGGDNSWFDPHEEHNVPVDKAGSFTGHGTHVAGIILGGNASGKYIGVAPGARWIAARIWNDAGEEASSSDVHGIFQWFMDPDGDPDTNDAPDVVNNSWSFLLSPYCRRVLQDDIRALRMAGIIPVFSAGNSGPLPFIANSPANYPETIAVGATGPFDIISFFSSRGPSNCDLSIFPDITAPGIGILSSTPHGNHLSLSGTSMAAPHVTGTIALMLDANPNLSIEEIETTLKETATPLGFFHPNNTYGWGRVDALEAVTAVIP
ncbi:MAG: S8 family serine peptidase [Deltaproteobacteria bacterium]|nr:S8 family serine peptidase [Deltaproteobacteria bacterium]